MNKPRYVALCGAPESGKTEVAEILQRHYKAQIVDDGACLRRACAAFYGFPTSWAYTQEGKREIIDVCGVNYTVRQLLGDMGTLFEQKYSQQIMPSLAINSIVPTGLTPFYVFPSVRKTQGLTYLKHGGLVIEITRPGKVVFNDFDVYDKSLVTHIIPNIGDLAGLKRTVVAMFDAIYGGF